MASMSGAWKKTYRGDGVALIHSVRRPPTLFLLHYAHQSFRYSSAPKEPGLKKTSEGLLDPKLATQ
jgi:hypothetical protein